MSSLSNSGSVATGPSNTTTTPHPRWAAFETRPIDPGHSNLPAANPVLHYEIQKPTRRTMVRRGSGSAIA